MLHDILYSSGILEPAMPPHPIQNLHKSQRVLVRALIRFDFSGAYRPCAGVRLVEQTFTRDIEFVLGGGFCGVVCEGV